MSGVRLPGEHLLDAVEAGGEVVEASVEPILLPLLVLCFGSLALTLCTRYETRRDHSDEDREESEALKHHERRNDPAGEMRGRDVSIADGGHRLQSPPHPHPNVRVLLM